MKLYIVRHAQAHPKDKDASRPLTAAGLQSAAAMARSLANEGVEVATIWHSGKLRAEQTAQVLADNLPGTVVLQKLGGLEPNDSPPDVVGELESGEADMMLVSHEPFVSRLAAMLLGPGRRADEFTFPDAGVLALSYHGPAGWMVATPMRAPDVPVSSAPQKAVDKKGADKKQDDTSKKPDEKQQADTPKKPDEKQADAPKKPKK